MQNLTLIQKHKILFQEDIFLASRKFANLKVIEDSLDIPYLRGILDIPNDNGEIVGQFFIELRYSQGYPNRFPTLFEVGGEIPNDPDWHKYQDGSCCITVLADEILKCKNGVSATMFIQEYAIPYFANQIHRKQTGKYKNGEYAHGSKGVLQFYEDLMKSPDKNLWIQYFKKVFKGEKVNCGRNENCFCGRQNKFKQCHLITFNTLRQIGENQVLKDFSLVIQ